MCGLVGQYHPERIDPAALNRAVALLRHRGPDDEGRFATANVAFGFRRLAILDLSPAGHQPMQSRDGAVTVMHNGEVYNFLELREELQRRGHTFTSASDTEVILAAYLQWGDGCFARFNGMWAMAIWDERTKTLVLSRDRFGEKPLYWHDAPDGRILFASEIKAILAQIDRTPPPNEQLLFDYLVYAFHDHTEQTFFSGIQQLLPGHTMTVRDGKSTIRPYWTLAPANVRVRSLDDAGEQFRALLTDSIRLRLRSDVPLGSCLSGGLDSSAIVLLAHQLLDAGGAHRGQKTFTACAEDPRYDERTYSRLVNRMTNADQHEVFPAAAEFRAVLPKLLHHQEEPFLSMSIFAQWKVMEAARAAGITVLLDGQGGDEVLAGYVPFFAALFADRLRAGRLGAMAREWRAFLRQHPRSRYDILPTFALLALPQWAGRLAYRASGRKELRALQPAFRSKYFRYPKIPRVTGSLLKNQMHRLLTTTGVRALLHYEDRNAMAFSVESRVPFLDHRLAEFALGLPDAFLLGGGETKRVLRAGLRNVLPVAIHNRHLKMGFVVPQQEWLRTTLRKDWQDALLSPDARIGQYLQRAVMEDTSRAFLGGDGGAGSLIWRWYIVEQWFRAYHG